MAEYKVALDNDWSRLTVVSHKAKKGQNDHQKKKEARDKLLCVFYTSKRFRHLTS